MIKSIAIGSFDGIHLAHQELIKRADAVVVIERFTSSLTPGYNKAEFINKPTIYYYLENIKKDTPKEFIDRLKNNFPNLQKIIIGYDFKFGKDKSGSIDTIKKLFKEIDIVPEVKKDGISIHSRVIRELIKTNKIKEANSLLGRSYQIKGYQIKGQGIGSKELVPTINLKVIQYTLPRGVFAVKAKINNKTYNAICFIGNRATTDNKFSVEFFILEQFEISKTSSVITLDLIGFIRENRKFCNINELKNQIELDIKKAKEVLNTVK